MLGKVQSFNEDRGFGWILVNFRERYFFHVSRWGGPNVPQFGERVEFDLAAGHKPGQRPQAIKVVPVAETVVGGGQ